MKDSQTFPQWHAQGSKVCVCVEGEGELRFIRLQYCGRVTEELRSGCPCVIVADPIVGGIFGSTPEKKL